MSTLTTTNTSKKKARSGDRTQPQAGLPVGATPDLIRRRAYEIFQARNGGPGSQLSDWLQAEQELNRTSQKLPFVVHSRKRRRTNEIADLAEQPYRDGVLYG